MRQVKAKRLRREFNNMHPDGYTSNAWRKFKKENRL